MSASLQSQFRYHIVQDICGKLIIELLENGFESHLTTLCQLFYYRTGCSVLTNGKMYALRYNEDFYGSDLSTYDEEISTTDDEDYLVDTVTPHKSESPDIMEAAFSEPIECLLMDGRISLAYEKLSKIPRPIADKFANATHILDLSFNNIKDLSFLVNFKCLGTLILDRNEQPYENSLPYLPSLKILWLNNCNIYNMSKWITRIQACCPNLKHLSLIGNPGILSAFNGASVLEHYDYRMYVISVLPTLQYLDDSAITEAQRQQANSNKRAYALSGGPLRFIEKFGSTMFLNMFKNGKDGRDSSKNRSMTTAESTDAESTAQLANY